MAFLVYLVLYLYLHACAARPLVVANKESAAQIQGSREDVMTSVAEGFVNHGMDNERVSSVKEPENNEGKKVETPYPWKILPNGTATRKKEGRSTLENSSPASNGHEENVRSKENDTVEDIEVMDYAQPHRKPPIHNKGGT